MAEPLKEINHIETPDEKVARMRREQGKAPFSLERLEASIPKDWKEDEFDVDEFVAYRKAKAQALADFEKKWFGESNS